MVNPANAICILWLDTKQPKLALLWPWFYPVLCLLWLTSNGQYEEYPLFQNCRVVFVDLQWGPLLWGLVAARVHLRGRGATSQRSTIDGRDDVSSPGPWTAHFTAHPSHLFTATLRRSTERLDHTQGHPTHTPRPTIPATTPGTERRTKSEDP
jgi:hypothetical protein